MKITVNQLRRIIKEEIAKTIPDAFSTAEQLSALVKGMNVDGSSQEASFEVAYSAGDKISANQVIAALSNYLKTKMGADNWGDRTSFHEFRFRDDKFETSVEFSTFDEAEYLNPGIIPVKVKVYRT